MHFISVPVLRGSCLKGLHRTNFSSFLRRFRKIAKSNYLTLSCLSVRMQQLGFHWMDFREIWYLMVFLKSVEKTQVLLKSDKNNGHFTWRPIYIFDHISLSSSHKEKYFRQKLYRNSKHIVCSTCFFFS